MTPSTSSSLPDQSARDKNDGIDAPLPNTHGAPPDQRVPTDLTHTRNQICMRLEQQPGDGGITTVRHCIGNPALPKLSDIPSDDVADELDRLQEILRSNDIAVHFGREVGDAEAYRFITEEVLEFEMDDIHLQGTIHNFIYEELHPDDEADVCSSAGDFFLGFFEKRREVLLSLLCPGTPSTPHVVPTRENLFFENLDSFLHGISSFCEVQIGALQVTLHEDSAVVCSETSWKGWSDRNHRSLSGSGPATLYMTRNGHGGWDVVWAAIPGWNI